MPPEVDVFKFKTGLPADFLTLEISYEVINIYNIFKSLAFCVVVVVQGVPKKV